MYYWLTPEQQGCWSPKSKVSRLAKCNLELVRVHPKPLRPFQTTIYYFPLISRRIIVQSEQKADFVFPHVVGASSQSTVIDTKGDLNKSYLTIDIDYNKSMTGAAKNDIFSSSSEQDKIYTFTKVIFRSKLMTQNGSVCSLTRICYHKNGRTSWKIYCLIVYLNAA